LGKVKKYKNMGDCLVKTVQQGGFFSKYSFIRIN